MHESLRKEWNFYEGSSLKIEVKDISNDLVSVMPNPNQNIVEDRTTKGDPSIKDIMFMLNRLSTLFTFLVEID